MYRNTIPRYQISHVPQGRQLSQNDCGSYFLENMTRLYKSWQKLNLTYSQNGMFLNLMHAFEAYFFTITYFFFLVVSAFEIFISINMPRRSMLIFFLLLQTMLAVESAMLKTLRNQKYQFFVEPKFWKISTGIKSK